MMMAVAAVSAAVAVAIDGRIPPFKSADQTNTLPI
jgi:hypothetical protein